LWWNRRDPLLLAVFVLGAVGAAALLIYSTDNRAIEAFGSFIASLGSGDMGTSDAARSAMYHAAWQALVDSPLVGLGYGQIIPFAQALHPEVPVLAELENYHSDIANFTAMAGIPGLFAYGLVLLSALVLPLAAPARRNRALVLGSLVLVVGYFTLGLTNVMFGVLPQTMLYVLMLGYLMAMQRHGTGGR
jgi:O-antigen ligase